MSFNNIFASDGDLTNSRPVLQLRVAQGSILDKSEDRRREQCKNNTEYVKPYGNEVKIQEKGCVPGEIALKKRNTGSVNKAINELYAGEVSTNLEPTLVPHYSHLNQIPIQISKEKFDSLPLDEKRALIENEFQVGGIVGTVAEPAYEGVSLGKEDFVVEIGGIRSIINNSPTHTILQGQLVIARAPECIEGVVGAKRPRNADGTEKGKVLVVTEPYDPSNLINMDTFNHLIGELDDDPEKFYNECFPKDCEGCVQENPVYLPRHFIQHWINFLIHAKVVNEQPNLTSEEHEKAMEDERNKMVFGNKTDKEIEEARKKGGLKLTKDATDTLKKIFNTGGKGGNIMTNLMNSYHMINHRYQSMVIGQAQSDAPPNTRFDIKFGSYCL